MRVLYGPQELSRAVRILKSYREYFLGPRSSFWGPGGRRDTLAGEDVAALGAVVPLRVRPAAWSTPHRSVAAIVATRRLVCGAEVVGAVVPGSARSSPQPPDPASCDIAWQLE
jgi:hypothetical protein